MRLSSTYFIQIHTTKIANRKYMLKNAIWERLSNDFFLNSSSIFKYTLPLRLY